MTTENLKICIQKAFDILPIQLEIAKLENVLTVEEDEELRNTLQNSPIGQELTSELIKMTKRMQDVKHKREMEKRAASASSPFSGVYSVASSTTSSSMNMKNNPFNFGDRILDPTTMIKEIVDDIVKDPQYQGFNPYSDPQKAMKIIFVKMFQKILGNEDMIESIMAKSFDNDPRIKEEMEKFKQDLK